MEEVWALVAGAWGDSIACYGHICRYAKEHGLEKVNVVYHGLHTEVIPFLKKQKYIGKVSVLALEEPVRTEAGLDPIGFFNFFQSAELLSTNFAGWMRATGLDQQIPNLLPTHVSRELPTECYRDFELYLPDVKTDWTMLQQPYLLFQPYSCQSCPLHMHWEYWMEALDWVLENTTLGIVLIGNKTSEFDPNFRFPQVNNPRVINLVGQTESLLDVFHIMKGAEGVITTSNSLSMWSIVTKKPALVVCHKLIRTSYFYQWINYPPNHVLNVAINLEDFKKECAVWFSGLQKKCPLPSIP
jgi:hypothetical protein